MKQLIYEADGKYYLSTNSDGPDTEISEWQFDSLTNLSRGPVSENLSEASILRLHQESDPASPLYKGPQPTDGGEPFRDLPVEEPTAPGYYEEPARSAPVEVSPESTGTSVHTTEAATAANAGVTQEEVAPEVKPDTKDESNPQS